MTRKAFLFHYVYALNRCPNRHSGNPHAYCTRLLSPLWLSPKHPPFCRPGTRGAWDSLGPGSRSRARGAACSPPARQDHYPVSTREPSRQKGLGLLGISLKRKILMPLTCIPWASRLQSLQPSLQTRPQRHPRQGSRMTTFPSET